MNSRLGVPVARHVVTALCVPGWLVMAGVDALRRHWHGEAERSAAEFVAIWPDAWVINPDGTRRDVQ